MTYTDAFLVEKLREILLRLYPTPFPNPVASVSAQRNGQELFSQETFDAASNNRAYVKREENEEDSVEEVEHGNNKSSSSNSIIRAMLYNKSSEVDLFTQNSDIGIVHNFTSSAETTGENSSYIVGNFSFQPRLDYSDHFSKVVDESLVPRNVSEVYGVPSSPAANEYLDKTTLSRHLEELIEVLKMSLSSNSESLGESFPGNVDSKNFEVSDESVLNSVSVKNSAGMEFNLTMDDIADLNNLLSDGSGSSLQFKHFLIIFSYVLIGCVSIVGNLLVVQLVIRSRRLHTLTHALLANLALADLCMAILNIPFSAARVILYEWPFGSVLCHAVPFVQVTSVYVTSITMAVIAIDRYSVIMNPLGKRMKSSHGVLLVFVIWMVSAILSLPYAIHHKVVTILTIKVVRRCQADFGSISSRRWLTIGTFLAQYLIPLGFTSISYFAIMQRLRSRSSVLGSTTPRQIAAQSRAKKKTIKMLVITVVFFAFSWAPINIYHLLTHFSLVRHDSIAILICHLIAMSSCTVNPFIYCWFNEHFRREALKWARCFRTRRCPIVHPAVEINGMLTRADRVSHRAQSTTLIHTSGSMCRRSPQTFHSSSGTGPSSSSGLIMNHTTTRVNVTSDELTVPLSHTNTIIGKRCLRSGGGDPFLRHHHHHHPCDSPTPSSSNNATKDLTSPVGYRPESLFLAKRTSMDDIFVDDLEYGIKHTIPSMDKEDSNNGGLENACCITTHHEDNLLQDTNLNGATATDEGVIVEIEMSQKKIKSSHTTNTNHNHHNHHHEQAAFIVASLNDCGGVVVVDSSVAFESDDSNHSGDRV